MLFSTASAAAAKIAGLTWLMIALSAAMFALVVVIMILAIVRSRRRGVAEDVDLRDVGRGWILWGGAVMPASVLLLVLAFALRLMYQRAPQDPAVTIRVTGHQWWWQLDYAPSDAAAGQRAFRAANELHIPVGKPVRLLLTAADVIHSFWVPQLNGKLDLIPGDTNDLRIEASRAGRFTGACAEYCGAQHAHMAITVVAEDSAAFAAWEAVQASAAATPADSASVTGEHIFATGACAACHTVRGVVARSDVGPDLTHVGTRLTLASGTLPNSLGALEGWIANPQALKPGALMPRLDAYTGPELRALATYVASLK
jgi:cytochrome c oxidase subunit 2